jgi:hypothetical protein
MKNEEKIKIVNDLCLKYYEELRGTGLNVDECISFVITLLMFTIKKNMEDPKEGMERASKVLLKLAHTLVDD